MRIACLLIAPPVEAPLGFLLLRDGHAVPLTGLSPDEIKAGVKHCVPRPDAEPARHRQILTAVVDRLGFAGDFGDYQHRGWPAFRAFLEAHGCTHRPRYRDGEQPGFRPTALPEGSSHRAGLFPSEHGGCIDLGFTSTFGPTRRQLADRVFESASPGPTRVFLGHGIDWRAWDSGSGLAAPTLAIPTIGGDPETARGRAEALFSLRSLLLGHWGFLDHSLVWGPVAAVTAKVYGPNTASGLLDRDRHSAQVLQAVRAFRAVFDASDAGWVDLLPYNDRLVVLRDERAGDRG